MGATSSSETSTLGSSLKRVPAGIAVGLSTSPSVRAAGHEYTRALASGIVSASPCRWSRPQLVEPHQPAEDRDPGGARSPAGRIRVGTDVFHVPHPAAERRVPARRALLRARQNSHIVSVEGCQITSRPSESNDGRASGGIGTASQAA